MQPKPICENLLIISISLLQALKEDDFDEMDLLSLQKERLLEELKTVDLTEADKRTLARVQEEDRRFEAYASGLQAEIANELISNFTNRRAAKIYKRKSAA